ncbi:MAG: phosphotransferase [Actinobacteria bacterium]|nr:phosphotransferase [Actinomycetota bacterium]
MQDYTALTPVGQARRLRRVVAAALAHYDLEPARLRLLSNDTNGVFRLDTAAGGKYVVRVGLGGDIGHAPEQVAAETGWLAALAADTDIPVPAPVPARDGRRFVTASAAGVPGARHVVVFTWLPGRLLDERLSAAVMPAYGALMARLHAHGASYRPPGGGPTARYDRLDPFDEPWVLFDLGPDALPPGRRRVYEQARDLVEEGLRRLRGCGAPMQILHGDLHPWNVKAGRGGLAPFDFEDLMWGWPVQDVATALWYLGRRPEYPAWLEGFRSGYETVAPWPERHPGEVDVFRLGRFLVLGNSVAIAPELGVDPGDVLERWEPLVRALVGGGRPG